MLHIQSAGTLYIQESTGVPQTLAASRPRPRNRSALHVSTAQKYTIINLHYTELRGFGVRGM